MKKFLAIMMAALMLFSVTAMFGGCADDSIVVYTNAYFAPFEYYEDANTIAGVDVDIMNKVGEKLGKKIVFTNVEFGIIIDEVKKGTLCDVGAAGITITDERAEKVDFSNPYFTSVQYVIYKEGDTSITDVIKQDGDVSYVLWDNLAGKTIGVQRDTTGDIYVDGEINGTEADPDYGYDGAIYGTGASSTQYDSAQMAVNALLSDYVDVVVVDKLPADYLASNTEGVAAVALYYAGADGEPDSPTMEEYAICVTKGQDELLAAINEVLAELGKDGVDALVKKHMGIED